MSSSRFLNVQVGSLKEGFLQVFLGGSSRVSVKVSVKVSFRVFAECCLGFFWDAIKGVI